METKVTKVEVGKMKQAERWRTTNAMENHRYYEANHRDILKVYKELGDGRCYEIWGITKPALNNLIKKYGKEYGIDENSKVAYDRIALYPNKATLGSTIINGFVSVISAKNNLISWLEGIISWLEGICQHNEEIINNQDQLIELLKLKLHQLESKDACLSEIFDKHDQKQLSEMIAIFKKEGVFI